MLGDSSTRALRNDIFPPEKGHYVYSKHSFECNSTFRGMLSYTAIGNLPETRLLSSANRSPAWRVLPGERPGSLPLAWGMRWCRKGELGRESWSVGPRPAVRGGATRLAPRASSSAAAGRRGAGQNGDKEKQ